MSANDTAAKKATAAQKRRERAAAKKAADKAAAEPTLGRSGLDLVAEPVPAETVEPPVAETGEQASVVAIEKAASKRRLTAAVRNQITELHDEGKSVAAIATTAGLSEERVQEILDAAASAAPATPSAPKAATPSGPKTLLDSFNAILAKPIPKGQRRERVVASLSTGQNHGDLVEIVAALSALADGDANAPKLAKAVNALNAALSAHYERTA